MKTYESYKRPLLYLTILFSCWGFLSLFDVGNLSYSGYITDGNNTIIQIMDDSPAERAGLQVNDYIRSIGGIPVEDSAARSRRPRAATGEVRTHILERTGSSMEVDLTYEALTSGSKAMTYMSILIGFFFLIPPLLPFERISNIRTLLLAVSGLGLGFSFFSGPYFLSYTIRALVGTLSFVSVAIGFVALLHFALVFPHRKGLLDRPLFVKLLYLPAALVLVFMLYRGIFQPPATSTINRLTTMLIGVFILLYFGSAAIVFIRSFIKAPASDRKVLGLNILLLGTLLGFAPILISTIVRLAAPQVVLPGSRFYFLALGLIPLSLTWASLKREAVPAPVP